MAKSVGSRSRNAERTKPVPQTPTSVHEIVPGKFNETDWNQLLEKDSNEEFILDLVDEYVDAALHAIYGRYLERQLVPFTITQAKDAIVEIIQWHFLARDEGEENISSDQGWAEDTEPDPCVTDCWAQGSIPVNYVSLGSAKPSGTSASEAVKGDAQQSEYTGTSQMVDETTQEPEEYLDFVSSDDQPALLEQQTEIKEETSKKTFSFVPSFSSDRKKSSKKSSAKVKSEPDSSIHPASSQQATPAAQFSISQPCSQYEKLVTGNMLSNREAMLDEVGNVIAVAKVDPEKLPSHKVAVKYAVVEMVSDVPPEKPKKSALANKSKKMSHPSLSTLEKDEGGSQRDMIRQESSFKERKSIKPSGSLFVTPLRSQVSSIKELSRNSVTDNHNNEPRLSVIDTMDVSAGVIVREAGRVKKGPGRYYGKLDILEESNKGLKPVTLKITNGTMRVCDVLDRQTPVIRPFGDSSPLPPILPPPP